MESLSLEVFENHGGVTLGDMVSGHSGGGLGLNLGLLEVFCNLYDSMKSGKLSCPKDGQIQCRTAQGPMQQHQGFPFGFAPSSLMGGSQAGLCNVLFGIGREQLERC